MSATNGVPIDADEIPEIPSQHALGNVRILDIDNVAFYLVNAGEQKRFTLITSDYSHILNTLKKWCASFDHLELEVNYSALTAIDATRAFDDHVNSYCSAVPKRLTLVDANVSHGLPTMANVTSLVLESPRTSDDAWIDAHFPHVEELTVDIRQSFALKERLPHLKHFELLEQRCGQFNLKAFAELNAHIRSVKLDLCEGLSNLRPVSVYFPNLESLHYHPKRNAEQVSDGSERAITSIHFKNVKSYTIDLSDWSYSKTEHSLYGSTFNRLSLIQFDRLQNMKYIASSYYDNNEQLNFIAQYKSVSSLDYAAIATYEEVWRVLDAFPNLAEIAIIPASYQQDHEDLLLLMVETELETIRVEVDNGLAEYYREFSLPAEWTLQSDVNVVSHYRSLIFKRN